MSELQRISKNCPGFDKKWKEKEADTQVLNLGLFKVREKEVYIYSLLSCHVFPNPFHCYFFNLYIRYITQTSHEKDIIDNDVPIMEEDWHTDEQKKAEKDGSVKQAKLSKGVSKYLVRSKVGNII
jgi:hypothetical protein